MKALSLKKILLISLVIHLIAGIFSSGFHHFDEHFQIIEFLNYKLNQSPGSDLPWEFDEMIRPWFQIYIYLGVEKLVSFLDLNPLTLTTVFRIFTSVLGFLSLWSLAPMLKKIFKNHYQFLVANLVLHFSWFTLYLQARTSSESLGTTFLLFGLGLFFKENFFNKPFLKFFFAGILLSFAYLCRTQMAVMVAGFWFWVLFFYRSEIERFPKSFIFFTFGILWGILFGVWIDFIGYGTWTFVPWNYVNANVFKGVLQRNGNHLPWYFYLTDSMLKGVPPLGVLYVLSLIYVWIKNPKHLITFITIPLWFLHTMISHKELRYIFPLIPFASLALAKVYFDLNLNFNKFLKFNYGLNIFLLIVVIFRPANTSHKFYEFMYAHPEIKEIVAIESSPYRMLDLPLNFYIPKNLVVKVEKHPSDIVFDGSSKYLFFHRAIEAQEFLKSKQCETVYSTYPSFLYQYDFKNWLSRSRAWTLFKCH